ncbi:HAD family hydrolase [Brachybacterium fresconis]
MRHAGLVFRAVIFDLDDTLFDHASSARLGVARLVEEMGAEATPTVVAAWERHAERLAERRGLGEIDGPQYRRLRVRGLLESLGPAQSISDPECDRIYARFVELYEREWIGFDDAVPVLRELHRQGVRLAILTNGPEARQQRKAHHLGIREYVSGVWTSEALGAAKPRPSTYRAVCEALEVDPSYVLHVGDNEDLDLRGATQAGLHGLHLDRAERLPRSPRRITRLVDVLPIVMSE